MLTALVGLVGWVILGAVCGGIALGIIKTLDWLFDNAL